VIALVRDKKHKEELEKEFGLKHVLDMSQKDFEKTLDSICETMSVKVALDCVGGDTTGKLMRHLGFDGVLIHYGNLSGKELSGIESKDLTFKRKTLKGFNVMHWVKGLKEDERL